MAHPNIVEIVWHDLGRSLGCYGYGDIRSSRLDELAADGACVQNMFCTAPQCSPARASIMTGCYPHSVGMLGLAHGGGWEYADGQRTITHVLKEHGYSTHLVGHHHESYRNDDTPARTRLGYDSVRALSVGGCRHDVVAPEACTFIREEATAGQPFFLSIGFTDVHRRFDTSFNGEVTAGDIAAVKLPHYIPDVEGARRDYAEFAKAIEAADRSVGTILDELRRSGLDRDTIVLFVTDHGPEFNRAKMTLYDPGLGVACLLRSPGRIQPGLRLDGLRSTIDLLPTLLDLAGVTIPEFVQGESFAGALGGGDEKPREFIVGEKTWHVKLDPMRCIRTDRYKYIRNYHHNEPMQISAQHSRAVGLDRVGELYGHRRDPEELYDLLNDPDETENLADRPNYAETTDRLRSMLLRVLRETGDPLITGSWYQPRSRMPRTFWVQRGNRFSVEFNREDG